MNKNTSHPGYFCFSLRAKQGTWRADRSFDLVSGSFLFLWCSYMDPCPFLTMKETGRDEWRREVNKHDETQRKTRNTSHNIGKRGEQENKENEIMRP